MSSSPPPPRLLFGDFELRLDSGELFQSGQPVKLQPQPAKILEILASHSGEVVSREELRRLVWEDTFLDFDASLNFCIKQIRQALGDSASEPQYVETFPRRGYRFLKPVRIEPPPETREKIAGAPPEPSVTAPPNRWPRLAALAAGAGAVILLIVLVGSRHRNQTDSPSAAAPSRLGSSSPEAREAYLQGAYLFGQMAYEKAARKFQDAIRLDPGFAAAYALLARAQVLRSEDHAWKNLAAIEANSRRALELDTGCAEAHLTAGFIAFAYRLDWQRAGREFERAVALDPDNPEIQHRYAFYLSALGRHDEAIAAVERARELEPSSLIYKSDYAWFLYLAHRFNDALVIAQANLDMAENPGLRPEDAAFVRGWSPWVILHSAWKRGDVATDMRAAKTLMKARVPEATLERLRTLEELQAFRYQWITEMSRSHKPVPFLTLAGAVAAVGKTDETLEILDQECRKPNRAFLMLFATVEPVFDFLHDDPRFVSVADCLRLPADAPARRSLAAH